MSTLASRLPSTAIAGFRRAMPLATVTGATVWVAVACPVLRLAANRLVVGTPISAAAALGQQGWLVAGLCLAGAACLAIDRPRVAAFAALAAFAAALILFAVGLGAAASELLMSQPAAARARLASGGWIGLFALAVLIAWAAARTRVAGVGWLTLAGLLAGLIMLGRFGAFDALSLAVEYRARAASVHAALVQHIVLSGASIGLAALATACLYAWRPVRRVVEVAINGLQVVPAVALLGGLVALASGLLSAYPSLRAAGLSALGQSPAILAVAAYLLLPFWRGLEGALRAPDTASLDAATAIGLTSRQILLDLRLPIGAPILIGALRVASVQGIGLATLGALVGAGGLGTIVFDGMAQFAPDLILLGALPVIGLSLIVERGLSLVEDQARRRWRS